MAIRIPKTGNNFVHIPIDPQLTDRSHVQCLSFGGGGCTGWDVVEDKPNISTMYDPEEMGISLLLQRITLMIWVKSTLFHWEVFQPIVSIMGRLA